MIEKFKIPDDFTIDWGDLSVMPIGEQAIYLFLYAQRGHNMTYGAMQMMFMDAYPDENELERIVLKIFARKGGLEWTDF